MNKAQIRSTAKARFRDTENAIYDDTDWSYYIDASDSEVQMAADWPWRKTLTRTITGFTGAETIALPANGLRVRSLFDTTNDAPLRPLYRWEDVQAMFPTHEDVGERGTPSFYYVGGGGLIYLFPRPDKDITYTLEYDAGGGPMADIDVPDYPEMYHHLLVDGALYRAYLDDGNPGQAEQYASRFTATLERMKVDLLGNLEGKNIPLRDDWWE